MKFIKNRWGGGKYFCVEAKGPGFTVYEVSLINKSIIKFDYSFDIPFKEDLDQRPGLWFQKVRYGSLRIYPDRVSIISFDEFISTIGKVERPYRGKYVDFDVIEEDESFTVTILNKKDDIRTIKTYKGKIPEKELLDCFPALWINLLDKGGFKDV